MAELRKNTWTLPEWYDQAVDGATGGYNSSAGTAFVWGNNQYGGLGLNQPMPYYKSSPTQIPGSTWKQIDSGYRWSVAVKSDGTLWGWGWNDSGNLGQNNRTNYSSPRQIGSGTDWDKVGCGYWGVLATKTDGTMYGWGGSGSGVGPGLKSSPIQIPGSNWELPIGNSNSNFAVKTDGSLWAMGGNDGGALGLNNRTFKHSPAQVGSDTNWSTDLSKWMNRAQSDDQSMCIKTDGTLWSWGYNRYGQLGLNEGASPGFNEAKSSPCQVGTDSNWKSCGGKGFTNCATKTDGTLWVWGENGWTGSLGMPGAPMYQKYSSPTQIPGTTWNLVSSANSQFVTRTDGTLWCWGVNQDGGLGLNQPNTSNPNQTTNSPVQVGSLTDWTDKVQGAIAMTNRKQS